MKNIKQFNRKYNKRFVLYVGGLLTAVVLLICGVVVVYTEQIQQLIRQETESKLQYVSSQNVLAIQKDVLAPQNFLRAVSKNIEQYGNFDPTAILSQFKSYTDIYNFYNMGVISKNGVCYTTKGEVFNLSRYDYFKESMEGIRGISQSYLSEDQNTMLNIYTEPVYKNGEVEIIITATYTAFDFSKILNIPSFEGYGHSIVVNSTGELVAVPQNPERNLYGLLDSIKQYNEYIFTTSTSDTEPKQKVQMEFVFEGELYLAFYEPVGINDWYLITYVPENYVMQNTHILMTNVRLASLMGILLFCGFAGLLMYHYVGYQRKLAEIVFRDSLTKGKNFEYLKMLFQNNEVYAENKSLVVFDIDKFKLVNMVHGSAEGDRAITHLYHSFCRALPNDEVYHHKADEFVGVINHKDKSDIVKKLESLNEEIQQGIHKNSLCPINVSMGVCRIAPNKSLQRIYSNAMIAKNQIKGKTNQFYSFFDEQRNKIFVENGKIKAAFDRALKNKEFQMWYQPKFDMRNRKIIGAEALVRWKDKSGQMMSPGQFIAVFEENGQILRLDQEVLRLVCQDIHELKELKQTVVPISMNLSRLHLHHPGIVEIIKTTTQEFGVKPDELVFEITESAFMDEKESLNELIEELHQLGFKVDMDDYGTGISSLSSLAATKFDTIKLDKSFVDKIGDDRMDIVIKSTIQMASELQMNIVAEGIETKEQVDFLMENHCYTAQGYYFSRPLQKDTYFEEILQQI